jgi:hypothetical protein
LSDPIARASYDKKLGIEEARREKAKPGSTAKSRQDPQQKFNKFLNSLLEALIGPEDPSPGPIVQAPSAANRRPQPRKAAFNTFYKQAMEKESAAYIRGRDGVYRKQPPQRPSPAKDKPVL